MQFNELRPKYFMKGIDLTEENTTTAERTADGYQKTGDIVTLPYSDVASITQPYATTTENLNPFLQFLWAGICTLSPSGDEWFETQYNPDIIQGITEGNFDTFVAENQNAIGTVWNAWETQWSGVRVHVQGSPGTHWQFVSQERFTAAGLQGAGGNSAVVHQERGTGIRSGITSSIVEQIDTEVVNDRLISRAGSSIYSCKKCNI